MIYNNVDSKNMSKIFLGPFAKAPNYIEECQVELKMQKVLNWALGPRCYLITRSSLEQVYPSIKWLTL